MVKPDLKRNYYADLDLPTDATLEDVKKQYRKLALKFHPDRNPGKEAECIPRFQAIQAAHEVLEDPATKAKYDADRRKAGLYPTFSKPATTAARNPYATTSNWPPPPRRAPTTNTWRSTTGAGQGTPSGNDRFNNFPRPPPPTSKKGAAQERANVFTAWQNMQNAQKTQGQTTPQRPRAPPRADTKFPSEEEIRAGMNYRKAEERKSAYAQFNASPNNNPGVNRSNTTKTPRKNGFDPMAPGSDERQASSTYSYSTRPRSQDTPQNMPFPPPPPPRNDKSDPLRQFRSNEDVPFAEGTRQRTPYSSHIGEKTYFSSDPLRRSQSTRNASKMSGGNAANGNSARHHSSSPPVNKTGAQTGTSRKPFVVYSSSDDDSSSDSDSTATTPEPSNAPGKKNNAYTSANGSPVNPMNRPKRQPAPPSKRFNNSKVSSDSDSGFSGGFGNQNRADADANNQRPSTGGGGPDKPTMYGDTFSSMPQSPSSPKPWNVWPFGPRQPSEKTKKAMPEWFIPSSVRPSTRPNSQKRKTASQQARSAKGKAPAEDEAPQQAPQGGDATFSFAEFDALLFSYRHGARSAGTSSAFEQQRRDIEHLMVEHDEELRRSNGSRFTFPLNEDMFGSSSKSRSEENINTTFTPSAWSGTFGSNSAADMFAPPPPSRKPSSPVRRTRDATQSRTQPPLGPSMDGADASNQAPYPSFGMPSYVPPPPPPPPAPPVDTKFSAEQWAENLKDPSWAFNPDRPDSPARSTSRGAGPRKASRAVKPTVTPKPATVESLDEKYESAKDAATGSGTGSADAMDIDATPPAPASAPAQPPSASTTKEPRLYAVPPSPWRQSQPGSAAPTHSPPSTHAPLRTSLADLATAIPTATTTSTSSSGPGLASLSAISSTLPFPSKPSASHPLRSFEPRTLQLPARPVAPEAPSRLSWQTWRGYVKAMAVYVAAFHRFNGEMLAHFEARQAMGLRLVEAGVKCLEAVGEAGSISSAKNVGENGGEDDGGISSGTGFLSYAQAVKEDERVREHWSYGCEKHGEAVRRFEGVRERVRVLCEGSGLSEV